MKYFLSSPSHYSRFTILSSEVGLSIGGLNVCVCVCVVKTVDGYLFLWKHPQTLSSSLQSFGTISFFLGSYLRFFSHCPCQSEMGTVERRVRRVGSRLSLVVPNSKGSTPFYSRTSQTEGVDVFSERRKNWVGFMTSLDLPTNQTPFVFFPFSTSGCR